MQTVKYPSKTVKKIEKDILKSEKFAVNLTKSLLNYKKYNRFLRILGPGLVTGAADDQVDTAVSAHQEGQIVVPDWQAQRG